MDTKKILEQIKNQEELRIQAIKDESKPIIAKIELINKLKKAKKTPGFFKESCKLLCWNSPAYCCKSGKHGKPCIWRDTFLELNNLSQKDFEEMKETFNREFIERKSI